MVSRRFSRRSGFIWLVLASLAVFGLWMIGRLNRSPRWNLVVIMLDTTRADRIECAGGLVTPASGDTGLGASLVRCCSSRWAA